MIIEADIETGLKTLWAARDYVGDNSVPIREFRDNSKTKANIYGVTHVAPAARLSPNYQKYEVTAEAICISYTPKDRDRSNLEEFYQDTFGMINTLTAAALQAVLPGTTKLTIDGIVPSLDGGDEDIQDNFQVMLVKAKVFATYTP